MTSSNRRNDSGDRNEGRNDGRNYERYEKAEGKQPEIYEQNALERVEEKKTYNPAKDKRCRNCGIIGYFARDCRKHVVHNYDYYKNKMILTKQKEQGKALMAEGDHWLEISDDEDGDIRAHICLMTKEEQHNSEIEDEDGFETSSEVHSDSSFISDQQMHDMLVQMQTFELKLKQEQKLVTCLNLRLQK